MTIAKSSFKDLRYFSLERIQAQHVAEALMSFDLEAKASNVRNVLESKDYDVAGARDGGAVVGYVNKVDLNRSTVGVYCCRFEDESLVGANTPLLDVLIKVRDFDRVFVEILGQVGGIVTRGDLQKIPVRLWLFGLVSLIEMQMLRLIRESFPDNAWRRLLANNRLEKAEQLLRKRQLRNDAIDLADCLQFCDKRTILVKTSDLRLLTGFDSKADCEEGLKELEKLRDDLAHSQDIIKGRWPGLVDLAQGAESLLQGLEGASILKASIPTGTRN